MNVSELKELIEKIQLSETIDDLDKIIDDLKLRSQYDSLNEKYPKIDFQITAKDIEDYNSISQEKLKTPLEKLFYAVLWKKGDLGKLKHIIEGIKSIEMSNSDKEEALVFFQFGRFLVSDNEPIIDQHVLRAFGISQSTDDIEIEGYRRMGIIRAKQKDLIAKYKKWLNGIELRGNQDAIFMIDRILMLIGRELKQKKDRV